MQPMIAPKPSQMRVPSTLTNPFITFAENDSLNVSLENDDVQISFHKYQTFENLEWKILPKILQKEAFISVFRR